MRAEIPHARNRPELPAGALGDACHRLERRAWLLDPVHQEVVFAKVRQELLAQKWHRRRGESQQSDESGEGDRRRRNEARQQPAVPRLEPADEARFDVCLVARQQQQTQRRRDGQRHEQRRDDGKDVRQGKGPEEGSRQPFEHQNRHEDDDDNHAAVDDSASDLERGIVNHVERRSRMRQAPVETQAPHDVLDVDDGVVHDFAERDHQAGQHHGVDRAAAIAEQQVPPPAATAGSRHC